MKQKEEGEGREEEVSEGFTLSVFVAIFAYLFYQSVYEIPGKKVHRSKNLRERTRRGNGRRRKTK